MGNDPYDYMENDFYDPKDDHPKGYCAGCHEYVTGTYIDYGIGEYEYWGYKGVHVDLELVSPCCEEELLDRIPEEEDE